MSWNIKRILIVLLAFLASQIIPAILGVTFLLNSSEQISLEELNDPFKNSFTLYGMVIFGGIASVLTLYLYREEFSLPDWVKNPNGILKLIGWGFLGAFLVLLSQMIVGIIYNYFGLLESSENTAALHKATKIVPLFILFIVVIAPILEEIIFRRIIFFELNKRFNFWVGVIVSSIPFAAIHGEPQLFFLYLASGVVLALIYQQTKTLYVPILAHSLMNLTVMILQ